MKVINEQIKHILFGQGTVMRQEADRLFIQFSGKEETKQFLYPDAFEKYLKMCDPVLEMAILEELHSKQEQINAEKVRKQREREEAVKNMAMEKLKLAAQKKKTPRKRKTAEVN